MPWQAHSIYLQVGLVSSWPSSAYGELPCFPTATPGSLSGLHGAPVYRLRALYPGVAPTRAQRGLLCGDGSTSCLRACRVGCRRMAYPVLYHRAVVLSSEWL